MKDLTAQYAFLLLFFKEMYFSRNNQLTVRQQVYFN